MKVEPGTLVMVALPEEQELRLPSCELLAPRQLFVAVYSEERQCLALKPVDWDVARALAPEKLRALQ